MAEAFTTLSIVALVSGPLVNIIAAYPTFVAGLACFTRIQNFLLAEEIADFRAVLGSDQALSSPRSSILNPPTEANGIELESNEKTEAMQSSHITGPIVRVWDASLSMKNEGDIVLHNINLSISRSSLTIIVGPVGAGKSVLFKGILGEAHLVKGSVQLNGGPIAYCDQAPWLRLGSIRQNILGPNEFEDRWFNEVLHACALDEDLVQFDHRDHSLVGSAGIALSGGQKQRVALARAVYARAPLVVLDDVFSALDETTSNTVFNRLLGQSGLLRKAEATILLATHAVKYLPNADSVVVVDKGTTYQYASYEEFHASESYVELLISGEKSNQRASSETLKDRPEVLASQVKASGSDSSVDEMTRKTGDLSLYKFYLDSVGLRFFLVWIVLAGGYIFSGKMPRESINTRPHALRSRMSLKKPNHRDMAPYLDRKRYCKSCHSIFWGLPRVWIAVHLTFRDQHVVSSLTGFPRNYRPF